MSKFITYPFDSIPPLLSIFEKLCERDADGKEWWSSCEPARIMGYSKYLNFESGIAKAQNWVTQKGYLLCDYYIDFGNWWYL